MSNLLGSGEKFRLLPAEYPSGTGEDFVFYNDLVSA